MQGEKLLLELLEQQKQLNAALQKNNENLVEQVRRLTEQIAFLTQKLYGRKSEKTSDLMDGQQLIPGIFNEVEATADPSVTEPEILEQPLRRTRAGYTRREAFANLPIEEIHCKVDTADRICPDCGSELVSIGQKLIRQELHYIPAKLSIQNIYAESYECRPCRKAGKPSILQAKTPEPVLQHSYASASTIAWTIYQKYVQAVPLYRREKDWKAMGADVVNRQVLSNWILKSTEEWLEPVVEYMSQIQKQDHHLHMDETPLQVLKEPGRSDKTKSHMWVIASGEHSRKPVRIFHYAPGRGGKYAKDYLSGFTGYLHTDGYSGYNGLADVKRCQCWAHVRRGFADCLKGKSDSERQDTLAAQGLAYCNKLFELEQKFKTMSAENRQKARLSQTKPVLEAFWTWAEDALTGVLPKTRIGTAIQYALARKSDLETFLEDGNCAISNNPAENSIRPFTVGRKNWLFAGSPAGAHASACVYSLIETAKANGIEPYAYLNTLLMLIPGSDYRKNPATMEQLMPWHEFMQVLRGKKSQADNVAVNTSIA
jgi:transposase